MRSSFTLLLVSSLACYLHSGVAFAVPSSPQPAIKALPRSKNTRLLSEAIAETPRGGESGGTATIPNEVFNLIKSIVGAGVLSLPAGKLSC